MKDLELEEEVTVSGGRIKQPECPEGCHICITPAQGEPPQCDC
jgi:hypothetical protein